MERFVGKKIIVGDATGTIENIVAEDIDSNEIEVRFDDKIKYYNIDAVINGKIRFVDDEVQEVATSFFQNLKESLIELQKATDKEQAQRFIDERNAKIRREIGNSNVAFKCTYCDGGASSNKMGYSGVCSKEVQKFNVDHRTWCSHHDCFCCKLCQGTITEEQFGELSATNFLCYESRMLIDWKCYAGVDKYGNPKSLNKAQIGSLAVLTTRPIVNGEEIPQEKTQIFGVFLIDKYNDKSKIGGYVGSHPKYRIELTPEESQRMLFWKYHRNENQEEGTSWSSGLHRYLTDMECAQIIKDIIQVVNDENKKNLAIELLNKFCREAKIDSILPPNGSLTDITNI